MAVDVEAFAIDKDSQQLNLKRVVARAEFRDTYGPIHSSFSGEEFIVVVFGIAQDMDSDASEWFIVVGDPNYEIRSQFAAAVETRDHRTSGGGSGR
jgi:hypothetical protein